MVGREINRIGRCSESKYLRSGGSRVVAEEGTKGK
jgi:hypothetical protein